MMNPSLPTDEQLQQVPAAVPNTSAGTLDRRRLLQAIAATGIGTAAFQRAMADEAARTSVITAETIARAEWIAGLELSDADRQSTASAMQSVVRQCGQVRAIAVDYATHPALRFDPEMADPQSRERSLVAPAWLQGSTDRQVSAESEASSDHENDPDLPAFLPIRELARRLRSGQLTSIALTRLCLDRLQQANPVLNCVVTQTEDLALKQAEQADRELAAGNDRGLLHGIPWGAKDLIAVADYPTTWGAPQFREQQVEPTATVANRLTQAGCVLVAKLSLGALAMGDRWFAGMTRNPWNPEQGSSGSSAGSASAVAAGLVPFAIGSETLGSIVSPSRRCGITSLRPTFGRISRAGCMTLSWSMDKIGPMARTVDDLGIVFNAIHGSDSEDPSAVNRWFEWPVKPVLERLRIGHVQNSETAAHEQVMLDVLSQHGAQIIPIDLPREFAESSLAMMLDVEAATVFHELIANGQTAGLNAWPGIFRRSHFVSAVDFLHASRVRFRLMQQMAEVFQKVDLYVGGNDLTITNLTGHPTLVMPTQMSDADEKSPSRPVCATITGQLYDEATLLSAGVVIEKAAQMLQHRPPRELYLP